MTKRRIVKITFEDGHNLYRCERQGRFIKSNWYTMKQYMGLDVNCELPAIFTTLQGAQEFLNIHPSQVVQSEDVIWLK